jgi:hypothetical protein
MGILALGAALPLLFAGAAFAETETFDWEISGGSPSLGYAPLQGGGTLTATSNGNGSWTVDSVTGEVGGLTIAGVTSFYGSNNLIYPASTDNLVSTAGFAFVTTTGVDVNIWSFYAQGSTDIVPTNNNYGEMTSSYGFGVGKFSLTEAAAAPEPATWAMMGLGFAGLAFAGWRKAKPALAI